MSTSSHEVVKLDLTTGSIHTTLVDGQPYVILRPAVEALGLDWKNQHAKLKTRSWASVVQSTTQLPGDTQARIHSLAPVRTFLMLLATVNENRVPEAVRPTLVAFQNETADAIEAYWTQGGALNPRATEDQLDSLISRAKRQAEVLSILAPIVSPDWLETKARLVAARALGEEPEIDPLDVPLYVPDFLKGKGLRKAEIESVQSWFGRRAAAIYKAQTDEEVGTRQTDLPNGSVRETKAWTVRHLSAFEDTWDRYYAAAYPQQLGFGGAA